MDYKKAFEQAIIYIEDHLNEDLKVVDVASKAGYSYFHLNRQFKALLGESIGSYITKRRLANSAKQLLYTNNKIIDIALDNKFESPEAFSRAFKKAYKTSPQKYRKNHFHTLASSKKSLNLKSLDHLITNLTVHPKIVEISEIKLIGLKEETSLSNNHIKQLWEKFYDLIDQIPNQVEYGRKLGICESCFENIHFTLTNESIFSDFVGVEVTSTNQVKPPFCSKVIPKGRYAVFSHKGSLQTLPQTIDYIWGTWLLNTKEEVDEREPFELYDHRFLEYYHPENIVDIYIAIK